MVSYLSPPDDNNPTLAEMPEQCEKIETNDKTE